MVAMIFMMSILLPYPPTYKVWPTLYLYQAAMAHDDQA